MIKPWNSAIHSTLHVVADSKCRAIAVTMIFPLSYIKLLLAPKPCSEKPLQIMVSGTDLTDGRIAQLAKSGIASSHG